MLGNTQALEHFTTWLKLIYHIWQNVSLKKSKKSTIQSRWNKCKRVVEKNLKSKLVSSIIFNIWKVFFFLIRF